MNWDSRDEWGLAFQFSTLLVTIGTLAVTTFFTKQLVQNDNRRMKQAADERRKTRFKAALFGPASRRDFGTIQKLAVSLAKSYPDSIDILLAAFAEMVVDKGWEYGFFQDFRNILEDAGIKLPKD